jgi:hypothetical protein
MGGIRKRFIVQASPRKKHETLPEKLQQKRTESMT